MSVYYVRDHLVTRSKLQSLSGLAKGGCSATDQKVTQRPTAHRKRGILAYLTYWDTLRVRDWVLPPVTTSVRLRRILGLCHSEKPLWRGPEMTRNAGKVYNVVPEQDRIPAKTNPEKVTRKII